MPYALKTTNSLNPRLVVAQAGPWNKDRRAAPFKVGDKVWWNDPDETVSCSGYAIIRHILADNPQDIDGDTVVQIEMVGSEGYNEALYHELSKECPDPTWKYDAQAGPWNADRKNDLTLEKAKEIVDGDRQLSRLADRDFPADSYVVGGHTYRTNPQTLGNPDFVAWLRRNMEKIKAADPDFKWMQMWEALPEDLKNPKPYAWPGGYPLYYIAREWPSGMNDVFVLCAGCANKARERSWQLIKGEVNYEDTRLDCSECNERIESAYGDDAEPDEQ